MTLLSIDELVEDLSREDALEENLSLATGLELPTTSWVEGDVTLTVLEVLSIWQSEERAISKNAIAGGWLRTSSGAYLDLNGVEVFNTPRNEATYASCLMVIANTGTDTITFGLEEVTVQHDTTGKTYRNLEPDVGTVSISPGQSSDPLLFQADEVGSESSADTGEITTVVSGIVGATCTNTTAAVGRDQETDDAYKARCRLKAPAISRTGAGPTGKYTYVAITPEENGGANCTRCSVVGNSNTGEVDMVLANASGGVSGGDLTLVRDALVEKVVGPCETLFVDSAGTQTINVTYRLWVYDDVNESEQALKDAIAIRLEQLFALAPVGGWIRGVDLGVGKVFVNLLESTIKAVTRRAFQVSVTVPSADVILLPSFVPVVGTITGTITFEPAPPTGGTL